MRMFNTFGKSSIFKTVFMFLLSLTGISSLTADPIKVITFNILGTCWADPTIYPASARPFLDRTYRRPRIIQFLQSHPEADIIALQEVTAVEFGYINDKLSTDYAGFQSFHAPTYWSQYVTQDPPWEPNGNALFIKRSAFKNINFSDVPLSDDGNHATFAQVTHKTSNKSVRVLSVHLDSAYAYNREREFQAALALLPKSSSKVDIIAGDFNIDVTKSNLQQDIDKAGFHNVLAEMGVDEVTSPYLSMYYANSVYGPIDCVLSRNAQPTAAGVFDFDLFTLYPDKKDEDARITANFQRCGSDHFPVSGTVQP
jgi:endonuclease/exonuclease/phosphatase family metal-dependent hydrolase